MQADTTESSTRVALVGLGIMGTRMLASLTLHDGFSTVSAWDPNPAACDLVAAAYPEVRIAETAAAAMTADDVDLVYIACPPSAHLEYAVMAADAGKATYCEKPLGVDVSESERIVSLFAERKIANVVNFPFAANPSIDFLEAEMSSGALGDVLGVDVRLHFVPWPRGWQQAATWLARRAEGGYVREVGSHFVFLIEKLFGRAELVESSVTFPVDDDAACETHFAATLNCSGIPVSMSGNSVGVGPDTVEFTIWGSKKSIRLANWSEVCTTTGAPWQRQDIHRADPRQESNARFFDDLRNNLCGLPNTMATFGDALSVQRIVEAVLAG